VGLVVKEENSTAAASPSGAAPALALPDKPSIAVLPFVNMSGDPEQDYFADGMAEEIITALSRCSWLFVIARNSSFTYKGKSVDVRQLSDARCFGRRRPGLQLSCSRSRACKNLRRAFFPAASAVLSSLKLPPRKRTGNGWPLR
jgi:hypothetical protein